MEILSNLICTFEWYTASGKLHRDSMEIAFRFRVTYLGPLLLESPIGNLDLLAQESSLNFNLNSARVTGLVPGSRFDECGDKHAVTVVPVDFSVLTDIVALLQQR